MIPLLDAKQLQGFPAASFAQRAPFPWYDFQDLLTPEAFARLYADFPPLAAFERHQGLPRAHGQRSHDRYYLAYETSLYHEGGGADEYKLDSGGGTIRHEELAPSWQAFIDELRDENGYAGFVARALGLPSVRLRFAWHLGTDGSEVSPHRDADNKIGTHIFYFNTSEDWRREWGGQFVALGGKKVARRNPEFDEFETEEKIEILDNRSFLFKNTADAWHGVRRLSAPQGAYRRLFNVVAHAGSESAAASGLGTRLRRMLGR